MQLYIGTCSFTDPGLEGVFYPEGIQPRDRIRWYADHFNTVEIDSSYYALPSERNSYLFAERTPDGFIFNFKAFALMTGHPVQVKRLGRALSEYLPSNFTGDRVSKPFPGMREAAFEMFGSAIKPLADAGKLGCVLFQFPPWFADSPGNRRLVEECRKLMPGYEIAVEFRHRSWVEGTVIKETLALLSANDMAYTCVDEPQIGNAVPPVIEATSSFSYVRFHGRNVEAWARRGATVSERFKYLYTQDELSEWVPKIRDLERRSKKTFVMFNNCFANFAVKNAAIMRSLLDE